MTETKRKATVRNLAATLAIVWIGLAIYGVLGQISGMVTQRDFESQLGQFLSFATLSYWLPWVLFAPLVAAASARIPIRPDNWARALPAHAALLIAIALTHGLAIGFIYHYSTQVTAPMMQYAPWQHAGHYLFGDDMLLFDIIVYAVFAATLNIRNFDQIVRQQELDASRLSQQLAELRLQTLRMQINPHFLFNALNAISVLIKKGDAERAAQMVRLLSRFFRRTLESSDRHWVTLEEELDFAREYLAIAQLRFGDRLTIAEHCDPRLRGAAIPALLLQPLVENAVTHGLDAKVGPCKLELACRLSNDRLLIEIADDGVGGQFYANPNFKPGVGLASVRDRLEQLYGGEHEFELTSTPGQGTRVRICVPLTVPTLRKAV